MDFTWASLHDGGVTKRSNAVKRSNKKTSSGTILLKVSDSVTFLKLPKQSHEVKSLTLSNFLQFF